MEFSAAWFADKKITMADFKAHTSLGALWGVVWGIIALFTGLCSFIGSVVVLFLATVGSAAPDIDSPTGRPRELVLSFLGVALPVVVFLNFAKDITTENILVAVIVTFFLTRYLLDRILSRWAVHRGLWHSIPMALLSAEITYLLFWDADVKSRLVYTAAVFGGYLSHLILDEMYSVKVLEVSTKRSFGTALKLKSESKLNTFFIYSAIVVLACICLVA